MMGVPLSGRWEPVRGFESLYCVSPYGEVYSHHTARRLKAYLVKGYPTVGLKTRGVREQRRVHRIVAEAFHGTPAQGLECAHLDGNPLNNDAANLAWVTRQENELHKRRHGTSQRNYRRLTDEQADIIRAAANRALTRRELAVLAGVSEDTVYSILNGKFYNG
jgi:DNA-binding CsgD family transcriptional regulator